MAYLADYFLFTGSIFYPLEHQPLRLPLTFSLPYLTLPYPTLPWHCKLNRTLGAGIMLIGCVYLTHAR